MTLTKHTCQEKNEEDLVANEDSVDELILRLEEPIVKCGERLIIATRNNIDNARIKAKLTRKQKWKKNKQTNKKTKKNSHGYFKRLKSNSSHEKTWTWEKKRRLNRETTNISSKPRHKKQSYQSKNREDAKKKKTNRIWRLFSDRNETINHIISECSKLAQK